MAKSKGGLFLIGLAAVSLVACTTSTNESDDATSDTEVVREDGATFESSPNDSVNETIAEAVVTEEEASSDEDSTLTQAQKNAVRSAESYLEFSGFSRQGLIDQLSSEYGDKYAVADATAAVDSLDVDWNAAAVETAKSYLDMSGFSCQGLIDQMTSEYGDKYTVDQATYGATQAGAC